MIMKNRKRVVFYCSGCKQRVTREVNHPGQRHYLSWCATAGKSINMRRSKDQSLVLSHASPVEIW